MVCSPTVSQSPRSRDEYFADNTVEKNLFFISFLLVLIYIDYISLQNIVPFLGLLDAGVGGQAELLQPGQVGDVGEVPQLGQLVIREAEAGHRAREVSRALAEMLFSYYFLVMYV